MPSWNNLIFLHISIYVASIAYQKLILHFCNTLSHLFLPKSYRWWCFVTICEQDGLHAEILVVGFWWQVHFWLDLGEGSSSDRIYHPFLNINGISSKVVIFRDLSLADLLRHGSDYSYLDTREHTLKFNRKWEWLWVYLFFSVAIKMSLTLKLCLFGGFLM